MLIKLFLGGVGILWFIVAIGLTIWWRNKFTYVYFGEGSMMKSWTGTFVVAFVISGFLVSIIGAPAAWIDEHCPYLPDIIVIGLVIRYFMKKKNSAEADEEVENDEDNENDKSEVEIVDKNDVKNLRDSERKISSQLTEDGKGSKSDKK